MTRRRAPMLAIVILLALVGSAVLLMPGGSLGRLLSLRPEARRPATDSRAPRQELRATLADVGASHPASAAATVAPAGTLAASEGASRLATFSAAASPTLPATATVTLTPQPPRSTGTPLPFRIVGPLAIDGPRRRLYAPVEVHGEGRIGVFSAEDGSRLGVVNLSGAVAVDAERGRLLVDDPATGLHVLDAETREEVKLIQLPLLATQSAVGEQQPTALPPAASPRVQPAVVEPSGQVAIARWGTVWMVDVDVASAHAVSLPSVYYERGVTIKELKSAGPGEPLWILDGSGGAAWGQNISVHRLTNLAATEAPEVRMWDWSAQQSSLAVWPGGAAVVAEDFYEGAWWESLDQDSGKRSNTMYPAELTWLPGRKLLLAQVPSPAGDLLIVSPYDMTVLDSLPIRLGGRLAGYDRVSDQLLVTSDTEVLAVPFVDASQASPTQPPQKSRVKRSDQGDTLVTPSGLVDLDVDIPRSVDRFKCKASPAFETDQTAFCGAVGKGLYRTTDGGRSYQTVMAGLSSWAIDDLYLSPNFAQDRTLFVSVDPFRGADRLPGTLYHSGDAGAHWRPVGTQSAVAFASDFKTSRRMYAFGFGGQSALGGDRAYRSDDAGETWREVGRLPDASAAIRKLYAVDSRKTGERVLLGIGASSLFDPIAHMKRWPNQDPRIYRSTDEGRSWEVVLSRGGLYGGSEAILVVKSAYHDQALILRGWADPLEPTPTAIAGPREAWPTLWPLIALSRATTLRSYDMGASWHYLKLDGSATDLKVDGAGNLVGGDPDAVALAIYTLPTSTSTPRPSPTEGPSPTPTR